MATAAIPSSATVLVAAAAIPLVAVSPPPPPRCPLPLTRRPTMRTTTPGRTVRPSRGADEEVRAVVVDVVDEDAAHRVRKEMREEQPAGIDDGVPRLADAPGRREAPRWHTAEDEYYAEQLTRASQPQRTQQAGRRE